MSEPRIVSLRPSAATVVLSVLLAAGMGSVAPAQDGAPEELARDAVDPYVPGKERARFLRAAGADTELTEQEFTANADAPDPFVRSFDQWARLATFDKNSNGTADWFEAHAYRQALRKAVLAEFDKDGDGRLRGPERIAANEALAAGRLPDFGATGDQATDDPGTPNDRRGRRGERRRRFIERFDEDGDGELSDAERRAAGSVMVREGRQRMIDRFDTNGDGHLDDAERATVMENRQARWWLKMDDLGMRHFDEDGDDVLSEAESDALVAFGEKLRTMGQQWELDVLDTNADGEVSQEERQAMRQKVQLAGLNLMPRAIRWADGDGDGRVSAEERQAVVERVSRTADVQIRKWTERFDTNGDRRLDVSERAELVRGIDADARARYDRHDQDGDGELSAVEIESLVEELAEEWGVKPSGI